MSNEFEPEPEWWEEAEEVPDTYVERAKQELVKLFEADPEKVYYLKQLEVRLEKVSFHWVTARAVNQLINEGVLRPHEEPLLGPTRVKFVFDRSLRYYRRQIAKMLKIVRNYSRPEIAAACGEQADLMFFNAFMNQSFISRGQDINEFRGRKWTETNHNLDFIMEKDNLAYGCEVKNTWDYIKPDEMRLKVRLCDYLGSHRFSSCGLRRRITTTRSSTPEDSH